MKPYTYIYDYNVQHVYLFVQSLLNSVVCGNGPECDVTIHNYVFLVKHFFCFVMLHILLH